MAADERRRSEASGWNPSFSSAVCAICGRFATGLIRVQADTAPWPGFGAADPGDRPAPCRITARTRRRRASRAARREASPARACARLSANGHPVCRPAKARLPESGPVQVGLTGPGARSPAPGLWCPVSGAQFLVRAPHGARGAGIARAGTPHRCPSAPARAFARRPRPATACPAIRPGRAGGVARRDPAGAQTAMAQMT